MVRGAGVMTGSRALDVLVVAVLLNCMTMVCALNITEVLLPYPNFSGLLDWYNRTGVITEVNNQTSVTILAPSNNVLQDYLNSVPNAFNDPSLVADTLRYNVLLQYFGVTELRNIPTDNGTSVTTLFQTTGRANFTEGFITIYNNGSSYVVGHSPVDNIGNETILGNITQIPFVCSILQVSSLIGPAPPPLPSPAPAPSPFVAPSPTPVSSRPSTSTSAVDSPTVSPPGGSYGTMTRVSTPLVVFAITFASIVALL